MNNNKTVEPIYNLRVSEKHKYANDNEWFKEYMKYIVPYDTTVVDSGRTERVL